jgi:hypothetical protein
LKEKINKQPILVLPYFHKPFQVKYHAIGTTIGVVISQDDKPIAYLIEKLNESKHQYSSIDKELYVVIHAFKKWRHYLMHREFILLLTIMLCSL